MSHQFGVKLPIRLGVERYFSQTGGKEQCYSISGAIFLLRYLQFADLKDAPLVLKYVFLGTEDMVLKSAY